MTGASKLVYDRQSLTTLQRNNTNVHLTHAAWRAAVRQSADQRNGVVVGVPTDNKKSYQLWGIDLI